MFNAREYLPGPRSARVLLLLTAVVILNGVDLVYTLFAARIGELDEMNPLAGGFLRAGLPYGMVCFKVVMVMAGVMLLWKVRRSRWAIAGCWVMLLAYAGLGMVWYDWVKDVNFCYEAVQVAGTRVRPEEMVDVQTLEMTENGPVWRRYR